MPNANDLDKIPMNIQLKPIEGEHCRSCPSCQTPLLRVTADDDQLVNNAPWITDGDTIFGLYDKLVEAGLEKSVDTSNHQVWYYQNYDYMLWAGHCHHCKKKFCVIEVSLIDNRVAVNPWFVESYFHRNLEIPAPSYCLAIQGNEQWLVTRHETKFGVCLTHSFGPFGTDEESLFGPNGVSLCSGVSTLSDRAASLLLDKWVALKALARSVNCEPNAGVKP